MLNPGLIGGIAGSLLGVIGGIVGTWAAIRNTSGPHERAFTIKAATIVWVAGIVFVALLVWLPSPWRFLLWIPYAILLPLGIVKWNRAQRKIRKEESECTDKGADKTT